LQSIAIIFFIFFHGDKTKIDRFAKFLFIISYEGDIGIKMINLLTTSYLCERIANIVRLKIYRDDQLLEVFFFFISPCLGKFYSKIAHVSVK